MPSAALQRIFLVVRVTKNGEFRTELVDDLLIVVSLGSNWSDGCWREQLQQSIDLAKTQGMYSAVLTWSPIGQPTSRQRRLAKDMLAELDLTKISRQALVTDSALVRGALTAISWLASLPYPIKPFKPSEVEHAIAWLCAVSSADPASVKAVLSSMINLDMSLPRGA